MMQFQDTTWTRLNHLCTMNGMGQQYTWARMLMFKIGCHAVQKGWIMKGEDAPETASSLPPPPKSSKKGLSSTPGAPNTYVFSPAWLLQQCQPQKHSAVVLMSSTLSYTCFHSTGLLY